MSKTVIDAATRHELETLVTEHAWLQDNNSEAEQLADLYVEDGWLHGIEPDVKGRAAFLEYGRRRTKISGRRARHVCSNLRLIPLADGQISGQLIITLYRHVGEGIGPAEPCAVADAFDTYAKDKNGKWKIAERRLALAFESESHKTK